MRATMRAVWCARSMALWPPTRSSSPSAICLPVAARTGLRIAALRLPLSYGPGVKANVAALARAVRRGLPLPLANIDNRRSVLGAGNFADAVRTLLARKDALEAGRVGTFFVADA